MVGGESVASAPEVKTRIARRWRSGAKKTRATAAGEIAALASIAIAQSGQGRPGIYRGAPLERVDRTLADGEGGPGWLDCASEIHRASHSSEDIFRSMIAST